MWWIYMGTNTSTNVHKHPTHPNHYAWKECEGFEKKKIQETEKTARSEKKERRKKS